MSHRVCIHPRSATPVAEDLFLPVKIVIRTILETWQNGISVTCVTKSLTDSLGVIRIS